MALTGIYGPISREGATATLRAALDHGVTLFDTAPLYGNGVNEELLGEVLGPLSDTTIVTKFGLFADNDGRLYRDSSPAAIRKSVDTSLRRLRRERIDLLLQHRPDPTVPSEEVADCVSELIAEGKVAAFGLSDIAAHEIKAWKGPPELVAVQNELSVATGEKLEEINATEALGIAYIAYSPLARGLLTGTTPASDGDLRFSMQAFAVHGAENEEMLLAFKEEAQQRDTSPAALGVRWVLNRGRAVVAIPGCRSPLQVSQIFQAA